MTPPHVTDPVLTLAASLLGQESDTAWRSEARDSHRPPSGDWFVWLIMAGRGWGKTWTGAHWLGERALAEPGDYAVIGRSTADVKETAVEGSSGLLAALNLHRDSPEYNRAQATIRLPNGSTIYSYSAERPERVRGPNLSAAWVDELAHFRFPQIWTETLISALRIGHPQVVVTTTLRPTPLLRDLASRTDGSVSVTRGSTWENKDKLSPDAYNPTTLHIPDFLSFAQTSPAAPC